MSESGRQGSVRTALAVPDFRRVFSASFLSNTGRWMQSTAIGVLAWEISESPRYLGFLIFAQLGPLGILSLLGGSLADTADRRVLLIATQAWQMVWSFVLAAMVLDDTIGRGQLLWLVFVIGLGQGIYAPTFTSVLPSLAGPNNLRAAISLNSMQVNLARVAGPAIGGWMTAAFGFALVFAINAGMYLVVIGAIAVTQIPAAVATVRSLRDRVLGGFSIAARAPQVGRPLLLMCLFALFCLPFIGQLPALAELNLGIDTRSQTYGWFYAAFGAGAFAGTALVGTVLLQVKRSVLVRRSLIGFGLSLTWLASIADVRIGYVAIFFVGLFYLILPTTLSTVWQEHVDDSVRGRIAALWVLSFGGTVPFANLIAGQLIEWTSLRPVLYGGAAIAVLLGLLYRLKSGPVVGEELLAGPPS